MDFQELLVYLTLFAALAFLVKKYLWPITPTKAGKSSRSCGEDDCGCH